MGNIIKIIKEEIDIFETNINQHGLMRLNQRLNRMASNGDITQREHDIITKNLDGILSYEFNPKKSFGILLGTFAPNPQSRLYTNTNKFHPNVPFYEIYAEDENDVMTDSTGDEFWGVVRENEITTVMLRKRLQRASAHKERGDDGGLGVQVVATSLDKLIANEEAEKERTTQQTNKNSNVININGVKWVVDNEKEVVYQKNKPQNYVAFDDIFDKFDDDAAEKIYALL